jgi:hypothetical protein
MVRVIRFTWLGVRLAYPWVWGMFTATLWIVVTTLASIVSGIPPAVRTIADVWLERAIRAGFPTIWEDRLRFVLRTLAFATIVAGWIVLSFTTVFIVNWLL